MKTCSICLFGILFAVLILSSENLPNNHLYSEVNIKGAQEGSAVPRPGPSLPLRPPPRSPHGPLRPEITGQVNIHMHVMCNILYSM